MTPIHPAERELRGLGPMQAYRHVLGSSATERQRLVWQARVFAAEASWLLDQVGAKPGWRAVDVGIMDQLNLTNLALVEAEATDTGMPCVTFAPVEASTFTWAGGYRDCGRPSRHCS